MTAKGVSFKIALELLRTVHNLRLDGKTTLKRGYIKPVGREVYYYIDFAGHMIRIKKSFFGFGKPVRQYNIAPSSKEEKQKWDYVEECPIAPEENPLSKEVQELINIKCNVG